MKGIYELSCGLEGNGPMSHGQVLTGTQLKVPPFQQGTHSGDPLQVGGGSVLC